MKSGNGKKKNLQNGHTLSKEQELAKAVEAIDPEFPVYKGPNGPIRYKPVYIQPRGTRATCNLCKPPKGFPGLKALEDHCKDYHRVWKG